MSWENVLKSFEFFHKDKSVYQKQTDTAKIILICVLFGHLNFSNTMEIPPLR